MILVFPDLDTFRLALTAGLAPPDLTATPATVSTDANGRLFVETDLKLTKKTRDDLDRVGVTAAKRHPATAEPVSCWPQVVPAVREAGPPKVAGQTPVLFELPGVGDLAPLVGEMLRLGNDRQSYRMVAEKAGNLRPLLRVIGPPYYTLLRAVDRLAADGHEPVRAYTEAAPRVWVEVGWSHPFARLIQPAAGQIVLVRGPNAWVYVADESFRDVYDLLQLNLPTVATHLAAAELKGKVKVPLRLAAGNAADRAELWVLRGAAADQLDSLVRDADDRLTEQLRFAVAATKTGERVIVLRTIPSKKEPPVLPVDGAIGYKPYWKLQNLYLPAGSRLHPPIRRDAVRSLLADDTDRLVWLTPTDGGKFAPESVAENAFRPLSDWVEYVVETAAEPLTAWVDSAKFAFDHFVCADTAAPKPKTPPADKGEPKGKKDAAPSPPAGKDKGKKSTDAGEPTLFDAPAEVKPPSAWRQRRDELEKQFLDADEPLDGPVRTGLWPLLAAANAGIGESARDDAAVCWMNAMWSAEKPHRESIRGWMRSERPDASLTVSAAEFDKLMVAKSPTPAELRAFASTLLWVATDDPPAPWLSTRLAAVQAYLDTHDRALPVRAVWLVASRLAALAGADVLGLARVRDRILQRLLEEGLSGERDLPGFLRFAGLANSDRVRHVRDRAGEVHRAARTWAEKSLRKAAAIQAQADVKSTLAYLDLMFAFGIAKLGETTAAQALIDAARPALVVPRPPTPKDKENIVPFAGYVAGGFLFHAFEYRVQQSIAGKPHAGQLGPAVLTELDVIEKHNPAAQKNVQTNPYGMAIYIIQRMREQSKILEPQEKLDPYAMYMQHGDDLTKAIAALPQIKSPDALAQTIRQLLRDGVKGKSAAETRFLVLHQALPLSVRVGEAFTVELLALVPDTLTAPIPGPAAADHVEKQGKLLERALFLAAHFDRIEVVQKLVDQFVTHVRGKPDEQRFELVNVVAGQCLKSLRKLGLRDEIDKLLRRTQDEILKGKTLATLKAQYAARPDVWADALRTLLNLAAGYLTFGLTEQATPILDAARTELLSPGGKLSAKKFTELAQTYITAVGQGTAESGLARILDLFAHLDPGRVANTFTSAPYFSRFHLNLVEDTVLALGGDEFGLGTAGRRWLDEDELLVRRRVHKDMRRQLDANRL